MTTDLFQPDVDSGAIIAQEPVAVLPSDTLDSLMTRVHAVEHVLFPRAMDIVAKGL